MIYCLDLNCNHINPDNAIDCQQCQSSLLINNRYKAIKLIGIGGFGRTFLGQDECSKNKSLCIIKQSLIDSKNKQTKTDRLFEAEAKKLKYLGTHSKIPELIDSFYDDRSYYLIQEFIDGENLELQLEKEGNFTEEQIIELLTQILPIIAFVHQNKIIHRDIKPANIISKFEDRRIYLVDFGASKNVSLQEKKKTATIIGSAEYVAPEQARGKALFASDIYSLGVTCIHLLTNRSPFDLIDLNNNWIWQEYLPTKINPKLANIINKTISLSPNQRYQNINEIINDLNKIDRQLFTFPWRTFSLVSIIGIGNLLLGRIFNLVPNQTTVVEPEPEPITEPIVRHKKPSSQEIIKKETKSKSQLEEEALLYLHSLTNIQEKIYLRNGEFVTDNFNLPIAEGHTFTTQKITDNRIAIVALAKNPDLRNFIALLWGGEADNPENRLKIQQYQPQDGDFGVLTNPQISSPPLLQKPKYMVRFNYCDSEKPLNKFPNFSSLNTDNSIPLSYNELACPPNYVYSLSMNRTIAKLSAKSLPVIIYDRDGQNLRIDDN